MNQREILVRKIRQAKADLKTAGVIHRRDLQKHIRRMERELRDCDFQKSAVNYSEFHLFPVWPL